MLKRDGTERDHSIPDKVWICARRKDGLSLGFLDRKGREYRGDLDFFESGAMRVRIYENYFVQPVYDLVNKESLKPLGIEVSDGEDEIRVCFGSFVMRILKNPFAFQILGPGGVIVYEENMWDVNSVNEGFDQIPPMGFTREAAGEIQEVNLAPKLHMDEHIYGLGEHFTEFDKRGQSVRMRNFDTLGCRDKESYKNIPFYISSYGYGLYVNDPGIYDFEVGSRSVSSISIRVSARQLEYYLILGNTLKEILAVYMNLTGPAALPPTWSFGLWYSTGFKRSNRDNVEQDAVLFQEYEIPLSVMHFDCYWLKEDMWCDFVWDDEMYPDRRSMIEGFKGRGMKICLWINPYVTVVSDIFREGDRLGYLVKHRDGSVYTADLWHGLLPYCGIVDFTNPEATSWYQAKIRERLEEGVDVLKTDFAEDIPEDALFFNRMTGKQMRNIYSRLYNQSVIQVTRQVKGDENGIVWARSGCAGMQQFPVCWSGDPYSSYEGMAATLRGGLSLAMSGVPFWSHDMGGFYGEVSEEVFIRWSQFGLFSSHSRLHGTSTRQPWAYGERALGIMKKFIDIRYELMPYILENARTCVKDGISFLRPLVLEHPEDPTVCGIYDEYYFGSEMLVCPVFGGDGARRRIYLPKGEWRDYLTGELYHSGSPEVSAGQIGSGIWIELTCPLDYMPIFQRLGEMKGRELV